MTPPSASTAHARHARTPVRRGAGPRGPRRVSGPSRKAGGATAARAARATATPRMNGGAVALPTPLIQRIGAISESRSLDRLLRSRGWIAVLGVLLIGLVFMQVSLLKLNAGMGSDVEKAAALERGNALLQADVSKLESNDRIQQLAIRAGMVLPTSDNVRYLGADGKRVGGSAAAGVPSEGEASTALLPTVPTGTVAEGTAPTTTTTEPQTTSSVPDAALAQQQAADAAAAQQAATPPATATTTPPATATAPPATTDGTAATTTSAATTTAATTAPATAPTTTTSSAASVGGATPGG